MVNWAATSTPGYPRYPTFTAKPDIRAAAQYIRDHSTPEDGLENRLSHVDSVVLEHYAGDAMPQKSTPERVWLIAPPAAAAPAPDAYEITARHDFDGVVVAELRPRPTTEPAPPARVPSSRPLR